MSAMGPMESPDQGEIIQEPSALPSATSGIGGSGSGGSARSFECSLGLDEQVKNIRRCCDWPQVYNYALGYGSDAWDMEAIDYDYIFDEEGWGKEPLDYYNIYVKDAWGKEAIERLRTDPRVDVKTLGLTVPQGSFWEEATALHVAVMAGDVRMVHKILEPDFVLDINGRMSGMRCTALHLAAVGRNIDIVNALVDKGADPTLVDDWNRNILHYAVLGGNEKVVEWTLARIPELLNATDNWKRTPLHWAAVYDREVYDREEMVGIVRRLCLCNDIDLKALDCKGWSAFYLAVLRGHVEVVTVFLECASKDKIRLNEACSKYFGPPIQIAYERGYKDIELALMERETVKGYVEKLYRDRQVYVDSANAILVGAALIASVTFASWLQPPLSYTSYFGGTEPSAILSPSSTSLNYVDVEHNVGLRVFWVFNALSFYFAMATVVCGAATVLPRTRLFIKDAVEKLASSLLWTSILLAFSVVFVIMAFAIAGSIVVTPLLKYQGYMIGPTMVGGLVCVFSLGYLFKVVIENIGVQNIRVTRKLKA